MNQMYIEIINYANKRYNAGIQHNCLVINVIDGQDEVAFVGLSKKQANVLEKSIATFMRKNNYTHTRDDNYVYSNNFEQAIAVKEAEQELAEFNISKQ